MLARLKTFSLLGIDALPVEVEVDVSPRATPKTVLVGLPFEITVESGRRIAAAVERAVGDRAIGRDNA